MLDDLAVEQCRPFEAELYKFMDNSHPGILQEIREKKALDDQLKAKLDAAIKGIQAALRRAAQGRARHGLTDAQPDRFTPAHPLGQEHAADHQGHESGLGGEAAPRAGACAGGAALRADHPAHAGERSASRGGAPGRRSCAFARPAAREANSVSGDHGRPRSGRRVQLQRDSNRAAIHSGASRCRSRARAGGPQGSRFFPQAARPDHAANTPLCFRRPRATRTRSKSRAR